MKNDLKKIEQALSWRERQNELKGLSTLRLFCGASDGIKNLWIDRYGSLLVISLYAEHLNQHKNDLIQFFKKQNSEYQILFKVKTNSGFVSDASHLEKAEFICEELSCHYKIKTDIEHDFGLFIDTFAARQWLCGHAKTNQVLNLFAYTCAFAVVGKKYGAKQVTNIDPNQDYLSWGKKNAELNNLDFRNLCDPAQKYLPRHIRRLTEGKDEPYDVIISDPPAFLVGRGDDRLGRKVWPKLLEWFNEMQTKYMVLICNDRSFRQNRDLKAYFKTGLNQKYRLSQLEHRCDILGQDFNQLLLQDDYLPPEIYVAVKS
jgi:23S rRNA G2069 N7-methylase RlmK/C1962 C5-methylase RlmI